MPESDLSNRFLSVFHDRNDKSISDYPPIWLMRQAGRYLPEYRRLRRKAKSFLDLCFSPELASEITLQPINRFDLDAAVVFSDILVIPYALGQELWFSEGEGPKLKRIESLSDAEQLSPERAVEQLQPVFETLRLTREALVSAKALIGFCGAPWTVACYMIEGGSSANFNHTKYWACKNTEAFDGLLDLLVDVSATFLITQIESGANALQIFDSWAGVLPFEALKSWSFEPIKAITRKVKTAYPEVPIIVFPRAIGPSYSLFAEEPLFDALGLDSAINPKWAQSNLNKNKVLQGNLDPVLLKTGGSMFERSANEIMETFSERGHIFNLGHGVLPDTPLNNVYLLIELVRNKRY